MKKSKHKANLLISIGITITAILLSLILGATTTLRNLELDLVDYRFKMRGPLDISESPVVILAIDDQSDESTEDRWPWPRQYFAHVIDNLNEAGVAAIGVDVIFDQPDRHGAESDDNFAQILQKYDNVVLSGKLDVPRGQFDIVTLVPPYEKFVTNHTHWGLVSFDLDEDGFYRRYLIGQSYNDSVYSSFAVSLLKIYKKLDVNLSVQNLDDKFILGPYQIPKYNNYSTLINYVGPSATFQKYSFDSVLDDSDFLIREDYDMDSFDDPGDPEFDIPPGLLHSGVLKGKIVLIGATMKELHDDFNTPFLETRSSEGIPVRAKTFGVEIHANMLHTILTENYIFKLSYLWQLGIIIMLSLFVYIITRYLPTVLSVILVALLAMAYFAISFFAFTQLQYVLDIGTPILVILSAFGGHTIYQYVLSQHEKKMIKGAFSHYVPEKVVAEILDNPDKLQLGGEERIVTVMFSDVAGFTSISEKITPAKLVQLLNEYLTAMTDIVLENQGIIDKFEGDAIMAEFGVPVHFDNHAFMACKAALEMQKKLRMMRKKWKEDNRPQLRARIGINTGEVIVGNMGSNTVFDYTVMGDHVNLGSRLEGANKFYGSSIMISEFTHDQIKNDFFTRELDLIRVKGKEKPIKVFELIAMKTQKLNEEYIKLLEIYSNGLEHYRVQEWDKAIDAFESCLKIYPEDNPSSEYRGRCIEYKFNSPGQEWDGVTVMKEK